MKAAKLIQMLEVATSRWKQPAPVTVAPVLNIDDYKYLNRPILKELITGLNLGLTAVYPKGKYSLYTFDGNGLSAHILDDNKPPLIVFVVTVNKMKWALSSRDNKRVKMRLYADVAQPPYVDLVEATTEEIIELFMTKKLTEYVMEDDGRVKYIG